MHGVTQALGLLSQLLPGTAPTLQGFVPPDISATAELAAQLEAHSDTVVTMARLIDDDHAAVKKILEAVRPLFEHIQHTIIDLAEQLLHRAMQLLPGALHPDGHAARAELLSLGPLFLNGAMDTVRQASHALQPATATLWQIADREAAPVVASAPVTATPIGASASAGQKAVQAALSQVGTPYVWGGTVPGQGFDCSGLTQWAWRQAGVELPRLAQEQNVGRPVSAHELAPGDLAVWDGHVAMYIGDGRIVEAGSPVQTNPLRTTNMGMAFKGFFRPTG